MREQDNGAFWRAVSTIVIWSILLVSIIIVSIFLPAMVGEDVIAVYLFLVIAATISTGAIWNAGSRSEGRKAKPQAQQEAEAVALISDESEKRKNDRLTNALRQLSDDELISLRRRINSGDVDEQRLVELFKDD